MKKLRITIGKKSYDVTVEVLEEEHPNLGRARERPTSYPGMPSTPDPQSTQPPAPGSATAGAVAAPMAGVVKAIHVQAGDNVEQGQALLMLEAMKMENQITAPKTGAIQSIDVSPGDSVAEGQLLLVLE